MTGLVVCTIKGVKRLSAEESRDYTWVYLGKDLERRDVVASQLGDKELLCLCDRLHRTAERLRQPFLDFIADFGKRQTDSLGWWSSSCSWKDPEASDLFLLICYEHLGVQFIHEREESDNPLIVVIEDAWLFRQLEECFSGRPDVKFEGGLPLWPDYLRAILLGVAARGAWAFRLARNYLLQSWYWKRDQHLLLSGPLVAIYSYPHGRCLANEEGWVDPYLGDLKDLLEETGYSVCRFSPPEVSGFEKAIRRRRHYFRPLILYIALGEAFRAMFASWEMVWSPATNIAGRSVGWLLRREFCKDRWRSSHLLHRVFFDCMGRFLKVERPRLVVFPYENQPWERMLVLAAREQRVATLGYQHGAGLAHFMLSYFHGKGEAESAPIPDVIVTSGPYSHEVLAEGGTPASRLVMGGSLRFQYLLSCQHSVPLPTITNPLKVLVALPIEQAWAQHLLDALRRAFPDGGCTEGMEFLVKPHPMAPMAGRSLKWRATLAGGTFEQAVRACWIVIFTGTSTGAEALAMGRRIIRYRPELLIDLDVTAFLRGEAIVDCGDQDIRTKLLAVASQLTESGFREWPVNRGLDRIFAPTNDCTWIEIIDRLSRRCT